MISDSLVFNLLTTHLFSAQRVSLLFRTSSGVATIVTEAVPAVVSSTGSPSFPRRQKRRTLSAVSEATQQQLPVSFLSNASSNDARTDTVEDHHARQQQEQPDRSVFGCFFFNLREENRR
ncbi:hypothetical protein Peur_027840 [Populus x canadensis]